MSATHSTDELTDPGRLAALRRTGLLDSAAEVSFDRIGELARRVLDVPVALVSLVDADRQYFKCALGLPEPWQGRRQTPLTHSICQYVVGSSAPLRIDDVTRDARLDDSLAPAELGAIAYLGAPLRSREGHVLGTFCVIDTKPRRWTDEDERFVTDLSGFVTSEIALHEAVGDREANARREARRRQQAEALFDLAEVLAGAVTVGEVVAAVAESDGGAVDADFVNIGLVCPTDDGPVLELRHAATLDAAIGDRWPSVPLDDATPLAAAITRGETILLPTSRSIAGEFPIGAADAAEAGFQALAAVPFRDGSGAIGFGWRAEHPLGERRRILTTVAGLVGQALERARLYDRERAIARELQASLLPPLIGVGGADIAARYEAGQEALDVGGDWFASVASPDASSYSLAVGDVVGHGVKAAGAMGQIRAAFEALALNATDLGSLVNRLDRYAAAHELLRYGTAVLVEYELGRDWVEVHSAGHVPAVIRRAAGDVVVLEEGEPPLGFDVDILRVCNTYPVAPGDVLVLYTDGLVERRGASIDAGLERLAAVLADIEPVTAAHTAETLLRTLGSAEDDAAVMVLRIT